MIYLIVLGLFYASYIDAQNLWQQYPVDFYHAMSHSKLFVETAARKSPRWQFLEKLYSAGMHFDYKKEDVLRIPALFHLIWLGSPVPAEYIALAKRIQELHPKCRLKIWTDKDAQPFNMVNRRAFDAAVNFGEKSDIFRYEILYRFGGVYLDGDFVLLKPFFDLLHACTFFAGIAYSQDIEVYNGLIGCTARHPIIRRCIEDLGTSGPKRDVNAIINRTGPFHFTRCFLKEAPTAPGITVAFPMAFFYPWPNYDRFTRDSKRIRQWIRPYSFAVHKWASSWVK